MKILALDELLELVMSADVQIDWSISVTTRLTEDAEGPTGSATTAGTHTLYTGTAGFPRRFIDGSFVNRGGEESEIHIQTTLDDETTWISSAFNLQPGRAAYYANGEWSTTEPAGQATMEESLPVVIASDQKETPADLMRRREAELAFISQNDADRLSLVRRHEERCELTDRRGRVGRGLR